MAVSSYFTLALLVLLLLPMAVLQLEGRRVPDLYHAVVVAAGLGLSAWFGGWSGLGWAVVAGLGVALGVGGAITALRVKLRLRLLTGSQIKLMATGATWVGPLGAVLMIAMVVLTMIGVAAVRQFSEDRARPDSAMAVLVAIMIVALQQHVLSP